MSESLATIQEIERLIRLSYKRSSEFKYMAMTHGKSDRFHSGCSNASDSYQQRAEDLETVLQVMKDVRSGNIASFFVKQLQEMLKILEVAQGESDASRKTGGFVKYYLSFHAEIDDIKKELTCRG